MSLCTFPVATTGVRSHKSIARVGGHRCLLYEGSRFWEQGDLPRRSAARSPAQNAGAAAPCAFPVATTGVLPHKFGRRGCITPAGFSRVRRPRPRYEAEGATSSSAVLPTPSRDGPCSADVTRVFLPLPVGPREGETPILHPVVQECLASHMIRAFGAVAPTAPKCDLPEPQTVRAASGLLHHRSSVVVGAEHQGSLPRGPWERALSYQPSATAVTSTEEEPPTVPWMAKRARGYFFGAAQAHFLKAM